jgi:hypothetical protein
MTILADAPAEFDVISACERYRYSLTRVWGRGSRTVAWVMLHPTVGDVSLDDSTTRRVIEFSMRWGYDRLEIVNLFAYRAANARQLVGVEDPVGPENVRFFHRAVRSAELVVAAWGEDIQHSGEQPDTLDDLVRLRRDNTAVLCFGLTDHGHPRHPLSVEDPAIPVVWCPPAR